MVGFEVLFFCFIAWLFYRHYLRPYYLVKKSLLLPGPPPSLYYGNYLEIQEAGYLESIAKWLSKYDVTFIYYLGIKPVVVTEDVEIIKSITVKNFDSFVNRSYVPPLLKKGKVRGLLQLRDEEWQRMRRILSPTFSSKKLRIMSPLIQQSCKRLNEKISTVSNSGESVDVWKWFGLFSMEVILATAFGRDVDFQRNKETPIVKAAASIFRTGKVSSSTSFERLTLLLSHFPWIVPLLKYLARNSAPAKNWDYLEDISLNIIEERRKAMASGSTRQDLLQSLLEASEENMQDDGKPSCSGCLSNDEILATIITILNAGYETTSNALGYTAYLLALNPATQDKLTREIQDYYDANPDASLYDAAENIDYVTMVLNESLRLYPPAPRFNRECKQTCAVSDNLVILEGVDVSIPVFLLHRNPKYWPNPEKFDPERFRPGEQSYPPFAYIPFGEGPRHCIGKRFALLEAKMALVSIIKDFQFKKTTDTEVPLSLSVGITMSPKNGIYLKIVQSTM